LLSIKPKTKEISLMITKKQSYKGLLIQITLGIAGLFLLGGCGSGPSTPPANQTPPTPVVPFQADSPSAHDETEKSGVVQGTPDAHDDHDHDHDHNHASDSHDHNHDHHHAAPHGGTMVALGDHMAHLELVLDSQNGTLTAYILDGEASNAVRLAQPAIDIRLIKDPATKQGENLVLKAVANALTGEKETDSSEFSITSDLLKGTTEFSAIIQSVTIKGQEFKGVEFKYPGEAE